MDRSHVSHIISDWQHYFGIEEWDVSTEQIDLDKVTVEYNGQTYFVGILRDFDEKKATIYHDVELDEEICFSTPFRPNENVIFLTLFYCFS